MTEDIEKVPKEVRPALQADGGDVNLVNMNNGVLTLKPKGVCSAAQMRNYV